MKTLIYSHFYEEPMLVSDEDATVILDIYTNIALEQHFQPEVFSVPEMLQNTSSFDHVMYHVENFGKSDPAYDQIKHYFN